jgi:hypothetical protein
MGILIPIMGMIKEVARFASPSLRPSLIRNRVVAIAGGSLGCRQRMNVSEAQMPTASRSRTRSATGIGNQPQRISAPTVVPTAAGRVKRIRVLLLTFYKRMRDRGHLAALELDARNDLRQDRVQEETRKRFWQS